MRELEFLTTLRPHPAICSLSGFTSINGINAIQMEYLPNGSLRELFVSRSAPPLVRAKCLFGLACALLHLHSHGAYHRHVTPDCILFDDAWECRLVDLGYARRQTATTQHTSFNLSSDTEYLPVEVLVAPDHPVYTAAVDAFAFGMIAYELITEMQPFHDLFPRNALRIGQAIQHNDMPVIPPGTSEIARDILTGCWLRGAESRMNFREIVRRLFRSDEPLFHGIDPVAYRDYRNRIFARTYVDPVGRQFMRGREIEPKDVKLFEIAKKGADAGNTEQQYEVGMMYKHGRGVARDLKVAVDYFSQAARRNHIHAMYELALAKFRGFGCRRHYGEAKRWAELAAKDPRLTDARMLYVDILRFDHSPEAVRETRDLMQPLANPPANQPKAQFIMGIMHSRGFLGPPDYAVARQYLQMAADRGDDWAICELATMAIRGEGEAPNLRKAIAWYQKAAAAHSGAACLNLANLVLGRVAEVPEQLDRDNELAMQWLKKGCELEDPESMLLMATWLRHRIANEETDQAQVVNMQTEIEKIYISLAESDSPEATKGQFLIGQLIVEGGTIMGDMKEGLNYLLRAAADNSKEALLLLADIVERGDNGVIANPDQARKLRERAARIPDEE
jgi:TPR repeat protein